MFNRLFLLTHTWVGEIEKVMLILVVCVLFLTLVEKCEKVLFFFKLFLFHPLALISHLEN